jgi:hypothetical protein
MQMYPDNLAIALKSGFPQYKIAGVDITHNSDITSYSPYEHSKLTTNNNKFLIFIIFKHILSVLVYLNYEQDIDQSLYFCPPGETSPFTKIVRLKLIYALLRESKLNGGCDLELNSLLYKKDILCIFPLHENEKRNTLLLKCKSIYTMPWDIPTFDLKEYFGEKLGLYYVFLGHYSSWLFIPAIIGFYFIGIVVVVFIYLFIFTFKYFVSS